MMNLQQALWHGRRVGVRYYVRNSAGCIVGGAQTLEQAQAMKKRFETEERRNPFTGGRTTFTVEAVR